MQKILILIEGKAPEIEIIRGMLGDVKYCFLNEEMNLESQVYIYWIAEVQNVPSFIKEMIINDYSSYSEYVGSKLRKTDEEIKYFSAIDFANEFVFVDLDIFDQAPKPEPANMVIIEQKIEEKKNLLNELIKLDFDNSFVGLLSPQSESFVDKRNIISFATNHELYKLVKSYKQYINTICPKGFNSFTKQQFEELSTMNINKFDELKKNGYNFDNSALVDEMVSKINQVHNNNLIIFSAFAILSLINTNN